MTLGTGDHQAIETLQIGQRVLTPESQSSHLAPQDELSVTASSPGSETLVDPTTWRSYTVRLRDARTGWDIFDITLLRPQGWMAQHARQVAGRPEVWVDFEELNARGWAEVIEEAPCPPIAAGSGRVVTATITHANDDVRTLTMSNGETLYVTGNHRMHSATRSDWVPVKELRIGEELRTSQGRESVAALGYQRGRHQVYNLEVETEHCYFVGSGEVLSHNINTCRASIESKGDTGPNAKVLRANMEREGVSFASDERAGHIVASGGSTGRFAAAPESRDILQKYGIGINDPANGKPVVDPRPHNEMHKTTYNEMVRDRLRSVVDKMGSEGRGARAIRSGLRNELRKIGKGTRRR